MAALLYAYNCDAIMVPHAAHHLHIRIPLCKQACGKQHSMLQDAVEVARATPDDTTAGENDGSDLGAALHVDVRKELASLQASLGLPTNRTSFVL